MEHATTRIDDTQVPSRGPWGGIRVEVDVPVHTYAGPHMCLAGLARPDKCLASQTSVWPAREVSGRREKCLGGQRSVWAAREVSGRPEKCLGGEREMSVWRERDVCLARKRDVCLSVCLSGEREMSVWWQIK